MKMLFLYSSLYKIYKKDLPVLFLMLVILFATKTLTVSHCQLHATSTNGLHMMPNCSRFNYTFVDCVFSVVSGM